MAEKHNCAKGVYRGGIISFPCSRNAIIEEDGKWWCKQHAPSSVEARRIARDAEWRRRWDERENARDRTARLALLRDAVVDAAVEWQRARNAPIAGDVISDPFFAAANHLGAAVDAYQAAKETP